MIDLRSDTVTRPSAAMAEAAATAEVGDDVYGEDPTANELQERAAALFGMEAGLFCPSGTMANQIAARVHTVPGQEVILEAKSHFYRAELAGLAQLSGLQTRPIDAAPRGVITPEQIDENAVRETDHYPGTGLVALENTHNAHGGTAIEPADVDAAAEAAAEHGLSVHLDGARLANAAVALDVSLDRFTRRVDSVMMSLSKGLGAPIGSVLAGSEAFIERAHRVRKQFGGGMRQVGVIAAPALLALDNIDRLAEDHHNAAVLARGLRGIDGLRVNDPETNIVLVDTTDVDMPASAALDRFEDAGVLGTSFDEHTVRFCAHLDVDRDDVEEAVKRVAEALS